MRRRALAGVVGGVAALTIIATANAAPSGSLRTVEEFLSGAMSNGNAVAISPDGENVYGAGFASDDVLTLNRNANTGDVSFEDITNDPANLDAPNSIEISPDGENAYVAGNGSSTVHAFERSPIDGQLSQIDVLLDDTEGVTALGGAYDVAVAGPHVYVTGSVNDGVVLLNRDSDGELSFGDEYINGFEDITNMNEPRGIAISPNGRNVYVASADDGAIVTFRRFPSTGQLDFVESDSGFSSPAEDVAVAPDGSRVYAGFDNGVVTFRRTASTGALSSLGVADEVLGALGVTVTPDGGNVYATFNLINDSLSTLAVPRSGRAVFRGSTQLEEFVDPTALAASPDGRHIYLAGGTAGDGHIAAYSRQHELELTGKKKQSASKLAVKAECSADCKVTLKGKGLKAATEQLRAGKPEKVKLKLKGDGPSAGKVTVKGKAKAGNRTDADKLKIKLK
jgi:DNA-binding beta-propeller fold protein YncE